MTVIPINSYRKVRRETVLSAAFEIHCRRKRSGTTPQTLSPWVAEAFETLSNLIFGDRTLQK